MENQVSKSTILDLLRAKKVFLYPILWIIVASAVPPQLPVSTHLVVSTILWVISLYYTYVVYWKGLDALGVVASTPNMRSAGRVNMYGTVAYFILAITSIFLMGELTIASDVHLSGSQRVITVLSELVIVVMLCITGTAVGQLPAQKYGKLSEQTKKYNYVGAAGFFGDGLGIILGGTMAYMGIFAGVVGGIASIMALVNLYKILKLTSEDFIDEATKKAEAIASAKKVVKMKRSQIIGLVIVSVPILFLGYFIFKQAIISLITFFNS